MSQKREDTIVSLLRNIADNNLKLSPVATSAIKHTSKIVVGLAAAIPGVALGAGITIAGLVIGAMAGPPGIIVGGLVGLIIGTIQTGASIIMGGVAGFVTDLVADQITTAINNTVSRQELTNERQIRNFFKALTAMAGTKNRKFFSNFSKDLCPWLEKKVVYGIFNSADTVTLMKYMFDRFAFAGNYQPWYKASSDWEHLQSRGEGKTTREIYASVFEEEVWRTIFTLADVAYNEANSNFEYLARSLGCRYV